MTRSSSGRGSETSRARPAWRVSVWCAGPTRNASASSGASASGSATPHQPNAARPPEPRARPRVPVRRDQAPRLGDAEHGERHLAGAGRRADPGRRGEDEAADRLRDAAPRRGARPRRRASGRSTPRRQHLLRSRDREHRLRERIEVARFGQRCRAPVARQLGHDDAMLRRRAPARARASSRSSRRARARARAAGPSPADRITKPRSAPLELPLLESVPTGRLDSVTTEAYSSGNGCFRRAGRVMPANTTSEGAI